MTIRLLQTRITKENIKAANKAGRKRLAAEGIGPDDPRYINKLAQYRGEYLAMLTQAFGSSFAEGGGWC